MKRIAFSLLVVGQFQGTSKLRSSVSEAAEFAGRVSFVVNEATGSDYFGLASGLACGTERDFHMVESVQNPSKLVLTVMRLDTESNSRKKLNDNRLTKKSRTEPGRFICDTDF
jgi:hypothetical protein